MCHRLPQPVLAKTSVGKGVGKNAKKDFQEEDLMDRKTKSIRLVGDMTMSVQFLNGYDYPLSWE